MSLLDPKFWLAILVWTLIVGGGCYLKGARNAENAARAAHATALEQTIKQANENAKIDAQALIDHERERQEVRTVFRDKIVTVKEVINANPTNCTVPDGYRLRLNELIDAANSKATAEHGKLPAPTKISK